MPGKSKQEQRADRLEKVTPASAFVTANPCKACARRMIEKRGEVSDHKVDQKFNGEVVCCYITGSFLPAQYDFAG